MTVKKKLELAQFKKMIEKTPIDIVYGMLDELEPILDNIEKKKFILSIRESLTNYVIIRLVSVIEYYFKNLIREIIDEAGFDPKGLFHNDEIIISLLDLEEIKKDEKVTAGRIISSQFNFQNLNVINTTMSTLLGGKSFFTRFNDLIKTIMSPKGIKYSFDWKEFQELFDLRHSIVHNISSGTKIDIRKLKRLSAHADFFVYESGMIVMDKVFEDMKEDMSPKEYAKEMKESEEMKAFVYEHEFLINYS